MNETYCVIRKGLHPAYVLRFTGSVLRRLARRRFDDFAGPDATGAREDVTHRAVHVGVDALQIRAPRPLAPVVGVADVVANR